MRSADSALTRAVAHKAMYIARLCAISRSSIRANSCFTDCLSAIPGPAIPREYSSKKFAERRVEIAEPGLGSAMAGGNLSTILANQTAFLGRSTRRCPSSQRPQFSQNVCSASRVASKPSGRIGTAPIVSIPIATRMPVTTALHRRAPLRCRHADSIASAINVPLSAFWEFNQCPMLSGHRAQLGPFAGKVSDRRQSAVNHPLRPFLKSRAA